MDALQTRRPSALLTVPKQTHICIMIHCCLLLCDLADCYRSVCDAATPFLLKCSLWEWDKGRSQNMKCAWEDEREHLRPPVSHSYCRLTSRSPVVFITSGFNRGGWALGFFKETKHITQSLSPPPVFTWCRRLNLWVAPSTVRSVHAPAYLFSCHQPETFPRRDFTFTI